MANIKSAKKRNRQNIIRRARNKVVRSRIRNTVKALNSAIESGESTDEPLKKAHAILARAASKRVIHRNTAARKAARLAKRIHQASSSAK